MANHHAYTLIELIIVVAILFLFSGFFLAQYTPYSEQSKLKSQAQKIATLFELARKDAVAQNLMSCPAEDFGGYELALGSDASGASNTQQYLFSICCQGSCSQTQSHQLQEYSFPTSTMFFQSMQVGSAPTSLPLRIQFFSASPYTSLNDTLTIDLKDTAIPGSNTCLRITVTTIGIVSIDDSFSSC